MKLLLIWNNIPIKSDTISVSSKLNSARKSITYNFFKLFYRRTKVKKSRRKSTEMDQVDSHYLSFATLNQGNLVILIKDYI